MSGKVSSCLQEGEHCSCRPAAQRTGSRPPVSSGHSASTDTGLGHLHFTSAGPADESGCRGTGSERGASLLHPHPQVHPHSHRHLPALAPSPTGALNHSPPLLPGRQAVPPGLHAGRRLAWLSEPLRSPLCWNATLTSPGPWGPSLGAQEPRPGLHRHDRAQQPEEHAFSFLSTVFRPCFINPPFVQVPQPTTLTKYTLKPSIPVLQGISCWFNICTRKGCWPLSVEVSGEHLMGS